MDPPPPSAKSSPHRFLVNSKSSTNKRHIPAPSKLRDSTHDSLSTSASQAPRFAKAPRFQGSSQSRKDATQASALRPTFTSTVIERPEVVEVAELNGDDDELLYGSSTGVQQSVEDQSMDIFENNDQMDYMAQTPKRRRTDALSNVTSSHMTDHHATPARFKRPVASTAIALEPQSASRPAFLRSSIPPPESAEPLPDAFSPHRRGQRFVPGGIAAEIQSWVFEAGQAATESRRGRGYLRGENWVFTLKVASVTGSGPWFVESTNGGQAEGLVMLVDGQGKSGSKRNGVKQGNVIGVRAPTWSVEVMDRSWALGVDWMVIS